MTVILIISIASLLGTAVLSVLVNKAIDDMDSKINRLDCNYNNEFTHLSISAVTVQERVEALEKSFAEKADAMAAAEKEVQSWNEGLANILNYNVSTAKGGDKK